MEGRDFEELKAEVLKKIDVRLAGMQKDRKCIEAAKDHDDLKACRKAHRDEMKRMRPGKPRRGRMGGTGPGGPRGPEPDQGR